MLGGWGYARCWVGGAVLGGAVLGDAVLGGWVGLCQGRLWDGALISFFPVYFVH